MNTKVRFDQLTNNPAAFFSLLLSMGYLTTTEIGEVIGTSYRCKVKIPNQEVKGLFKEIMEEWFRKVAHGFNYATCLTTLAKGNVVGFAEELRKFFSQTVSLYDIGSQQRENFYQGLMLGLTAGLCNSHVVESNKETGSGRYDLKIMPKKVTPYSTGVILEFKQEKDVGNLKQSAVRGLEQAMDRRYATILEQNNISTFVVVGLAFSGKNFAYAVVKGKSVQELKDKFEAKDYRIDSIAKIDRVIKDVIIHRKESGVKSNDGSDAELIGISNNRLSFHNSKNRLNRSPSELESEINELQSELNMKREVLWSFKS